MISKNFPAKKEALICQEKAGERIRLFINYKKAKYIHTSKSNRITFPSIQIGDYLYGRVQYFICLEAHPASNPVGTGSVFPGIKWPEHESSH
jgi:hypothetical protein